MSSFLNQQLTNVGWDALSTALGGGRLTFFKMQAGTGTIANDAAIPPMTALVAPIYDIAITSYVIEGDGQITLFGNIASELVDTGFTFKELGVFATIEPPVAGFGGTPAGLNIQAFVSTEAPSTLANPVIPNPSVGTPIMYSYCNAYETADYIPGKNESTDVVNTIQVTIKIDTAPNVQINILEGETFSVVNIGAPSVGPGVWSYTTANVAYLKRLVAGAAMVLTEDTNTITIAQKQLTADLDLFVANGNPDISPHFSTIQNAINYLGQWLIPTTIRARINVMPGHYTLPVAPQGNHAYLNHPNSQNITIQGPQNTSRVGTSCSITGSTGNWSVTIGGIPNTNQFAVNDWAIVDYVQNGSATQSLVCGFYKVTAKTASSVTLLNIYNKPSFSVTGLNYIQITPISAIVECPIDTNGLVAGAYGIGLLQYIGVVANATPTQNCHGVVVAGSGTLKYVGATGFNSEPGAFGQIQTNGIVSANAASIMCISCASTGNQHGFVGSGGGDINSWMCIASHNKCNGFWFDSGSSSAFVGGISITCANGISGGYGVLIAGGGSGTTLPTMPTFGFLLCNWNNGPGVGIFGRGLFQVNTACNATIVSNVNYDVLVDAFGMLYGQINVLGSRVFNIPIGVISSTGGLIL